MKPDALQSYDYDYIIIGSGFGGSVSALRLSEKGYKVCVLERGKRYRNQDFATTNWNVFKFLWLPLLRCFGIQNLSLFKNVLILSGSGVGGGSLVYANTLLEPSAAFYESPAWKDLADWRQELAPHYATAKYMLGVTKNPRLTYVDTVMQDCARELGREQSFEAVNVGVFFGKSGEEGRTVPDPYFGGKGPERAGCKLCGGCMVGCRHNSKNTLDKNYLYFAEKNGAVIQPESEVTDIRPLPEGGYEVEYVRSTAWFWKKPQVLRARGVVLSAGVLGTVNLLLRCRDVTKSLPRLSRKLGFEVRTNSEALLGITARDHKEDFTKGIAISSGFQADDHTYIEPVRYPRGSSFMRMLAVPMTEFGHPLVRTMKLFLATLLHPLDSLKLLFNFDWARSTVILLVMQNLDNKMQFTLGRNVLTLFRKKMTTIPDPSATVPSYIAMGHQVARMFARKTNGIPQSAINEVMFNIPTTAHILGGCNIGSSPETGVIDKNHEVFHYKGLYVADGSVIPANLGVNPSLTITAMTERALSLIPAKQKN